MSDSSHAPVSPLSQALGLMPSGIYVLTVSHEGKSTGILASWVQQAGFEPPMVTVAIAKKRYVGDWIKESGRFTLNQLPPGSKSVLRHFSRGFAPDAPAFEGLTLLPVESHATVFEGASAWLDLEFRGEFPSGDHRIMLGEVVRGAILDESAKPMVHIRHNGFHY